MATIQKEGVAIRELRRVLSADMQFHGQSHILSVGVERADIGVEGLRQAFAAAYDRRFGIELAEIPPVLVNLHTAVIGVRPEISLAALAATEVQLGVPDILVNNAGISGPNFPLDEYPAAE